MYTSYLCCCLRQVTLSCIPYLNLLQQHWFSTFHCGYPHQFLHESIRSSTRPLFPCLSSLLASSRSREHAVCRRPPPHLRPMGHRHRRVVRYRGRLCIVSPSLGFSVLLVARRAGHLHTLRDKLLTSHPLVLLTPTQPQTQKGGGNPMDVLASAVARLDVGLVVNNAGVELPGAFLTSSVHQHDSLFPLNVIAHARVAHILITALEKHYFSSTSNRRRGGMISISSFTARPVPFKASYSASKAFVCTLGLSLAEEWRPLGIGVTVVEPGFVDTGMVTRVNQTMDPEAIGVSIMQADLGAKASVQRQFLRLRTKKTVHPCTQE